MPSLVLTCISQSAVSVATHVHLPIAVVHIDLGMRERSFKELLVILLGSEQQSLVWRQSS